MGFSLLVTQYKSMDTIYIRLGVTVCACMGNQFSVSNVVAMTACKLRAVTSAFVKFTLHVKSGLRYGNKQVINTSAYIDPSLLVLHVSADHTFAIQMIWQTDEIEHLKSTEWIPV